MTCISVALLARSRPIHGMYCLNNYCWDFSPHFVILTAFYSSKTYKTCKISTCFASSETWHFVNNFCHHRCKCSHCSTEAVTKAEECICCKEIDRVGEVMSQVDLEDQCITLHPGFHDVCLNRWVLEIASLALKTKAGKSYRTLFSQGIKSESEWVVCCNNVI